MLFPVLIIGQGFNDDGYLHLASQAMIAEDRDSEWTIEDVLAGKYDEHFEQVEDTIPNLQFTASTYWMKAAFKNEGIREAYYLECARPVTNEVRYYETDGNGILLKSMVSGDDFEFSKRPIGHRNLLFPIEVEQGKTLHFVVAMRSDGEVLNGMLRLWRIEGLSTFTQKENLFLGIYYGLLIFVLIIFGFFALALKERIYTFYVLYVFSLLFMQASLDGIAFQNLWPTSPWMANHSVLIFSSISVLLLMAYAGKFLKIDELGSIYSRFYYFLGALVVACVFTSMMNGKLYEWTFIAINATSFIVLQMIIIGIFVKIIKRQKINWFFALAFLCVLTGGLLFISGNLGLYFNDFLTTNAIKLGSGAEVVFLSLAMAGRYQNVQREREEARKEAYDHLEALNVVTQDQNTRLEQLVVDRTAEIREKGKLLEQKNTEIIDSINYAKRIQAAILPSDDYFQTNLENSFVLYLPKDIVAGDFYWMKRVSDKVLFAAADCTGHGVPGAMVSVICNNTLNRAVREFGLSQPAAILDMSAALVEEAFHAGREDVKDGMDISLCALGPMVETEHGKERELKWSGANNPLWIITERDLEMPEKLALEAGKAKLYEIKADKQPIGKFSHRKPFSQHSITLKQGDHIYTFSDGFADQFGGERGKKYKSKRFKELLLDIYFLSIDEQKEVIHKEFEGWRGKLEQLDDVCVIGMRI